MTLNNEGDANQLPKDTEKLLELVKQYMKLEAIDKVSVAATSLIVGAVIVVLAISAVYFLCSGLAITLSTWLGSEEKAHYLMGGIIVLIIIIFYWNRKTLVENRVVRSVSQTMLKEENDEEEN